MQRYLLLIFCFIMITVPAIAAETSTLYGVVTTEDGQPLPGTVLELEGTQKDMQKEVVAGESGQYHFSDVIVGNYRLTASVAGFETSTQTITLLIGRSLEANIQLKADAGSGTVIIIQD